MSDELPQNPPDDALIDLLVKHVTEGLSPAEQRELDVLDGPATSAYLRDFERAAAAITLAGTPGAAPPTALSERIESQARAFFAQAGASARVQESSPKRPPAWTGGRSGWWAAAACLLLAMVAWFRSPPSPPARIVQAPAVLAPAPAAPTPAAERAALMARADALKVNLGATKDPAAAGVTGDVVWDPSAQRGFMRFVGLPHNDPRTRQYQIWIFDASRDARYPVDGGVFNVPADATEVLVPIHAAVPIRMAKAFAVTIETAGGVVVSSREHVIVLGQAG